MSKHVLRSKSKMTKYSRLSSTKLKQEINNANVVENKTTTFFFGNCYHLLCEEIDFLSPRSEFLTISPRGLNSILWFPCSETVENLFFGDEKSISSPWRW